MDEFKKAVFMKVYAFLPKFLSVEDEIELLFNSTNIKSEVSNNEVNIRLKKLLEKINKEKVEELDESLKKQLKDLDS